MLAIAMPLREIFRAAHQTIITVVDIQLEFCPKTPFLKEECPFCLKSRKISLRIRYFTACCLIAI